MYSPICVFKREREKQQECTRISGHCWHPRLANSLLVGTILCIVEWLASLLAANRHNPIPQ